MKIFKSQGAVAKADKSSAEASPLFSYLSDKKMKYFSFFFPSFSQIKS